MSYDTILAKSPSIIYQPGGAAGELVVTTWAEVQAFVALRQGSVIIYVDDSIVSPAHVPGASGVTDLQGRAEIRPYRQNANNVLFQVDDGATLKAIARLSGPINLNFASATVAGLDFDYTGGAVPELVIDEGANIINFGATIAACTIPPGDGVNLRLNDGGILAIPVVAFFSVSAGSTLSAQCRRAVLLNASVGGGIPSTWTQGVGKTDILYDSDTVQASDAAIPVAGTTTVFTLQYDTHQVEMLFTGTATNVLAGLQPPVAGPVLPVTGTLRITIEGFGGTGGGGGGQGGSSAGGAGDGGGASGGCQWQVGSFDFNLAHRLDITVGAGGTGGAGGATPVNAGIDGTSGSPSYALDFTSNIVLAAMPGSNGGGGGASATGASHGGATYAGAFIPHSSDAFAVTGSGFPAAGGAGGNPPGQNGGSGQDSLLSFNAPGATVVWVGGSGGSGATGGGGGGGGGAGPFANGQSGGDSTATDGNPGTASPVNSGAGAGGGGGAANGNGGDGGDGALGYVKLSFITF